MSEHGVPIRIGIPAFTLCLSFGEVWQSPFCPIKARSACIHVSCPQPCLPPSNAFRGLPGWFAVLKQANLVKTAKSQNVSDVKLQCHGQCNKILGLTCKSIESLSTNICPGTDCMDSQPALRYHCDAAAA